MDNFDQPVKVELLDNYHFRILEPFVMLLDNKPPLIGIEVPAGFITDLASVPRVFWAVLPPHGRYAKAAILHDFLLSECSGDDAAEYRKQRDFADRAFYLAMLRLNVPLLKAKVMYKAVQSLTAWRGLRGPVGD